MLGVLVIALALSGCSESATPAQSEAVVVFAAASTADVIAEAARRYMAEHPEVRIDCSFDASSNLARQIQSGAPASIFLSADSKWMDELERSESIESASRRTLFSNQLVLIAPASSSLSAEMSKNFDLAEQLPSVRRVAVGDPAHVPVGRYAKQALAHLGWWSTVEPLLLPTQDARAALRLVERGEADLGIVYATDARASDSIKVVGTFPADSHEPIEYPAALCKGAQEHARGFFDYLQAAHAAKLFNEFGFDTSSSG